MIYTNSAKAIKQKGHDCSFRNDEINDRIRFLKSQINYYETIAKINFGNGNGKEQIFCIHQKAKLNLQLIKFEEVINKN